MIDQLNMNRPDIVVNSKMLFCQLSKLCLGTCYLKGQLLLWY